MSLSAAPLSDGSHAFLVGNSAIRTAARVHASWLKDQNVADASDEATAKLADALAETIKPIRSLTPAQ